ncbi:MAG: LysR family transcriptional regulator [Rhodobacteraceae bacterium GWE1_64_9]|nr:MAG: LysR family transcriptional regulator [Rhodobacteraceae bacterium GWE1_64_9]OHC50621.1 MAG: LysR family transcriptional regulator [Rhodobacteraceae bacterium GWF1_65_7]HBD90589.1 LysR family transcriptional regulator [Gemmobacter sp.]HBU15566.1 LysR family transcriptional regulator [Gemmobacter sp.]
MDNRIGEMAVFVRVVELGSFTAAARALFMTPSSVSKLIRRLEGRLTLRLFDRSTRLLVLTEDGQRYYESATRLIAELDEVEAALSRDARRASGTVRVNASVPFGTLCLEPLLPAFWQAFPGLAVDLSLTDDVVDIYLDRTDVAFRVGPLADSSLMARRIGTARRLIVAAPSYLAQHGTPLVIEDLERHNCLGFNFRRARPVWQLHDGGRLVDRQIRGTLLANNGETVRRLCVAGAGLARLGDFHVADDIAAGRLVQVLSETEGDSEDVNAVFLGGLHVPHRLRLFLDFMVPRLQVALAHSDAQCRAHCAL